MSDTLTAVRQQLLEPGELSDSHLDRAFGQMFGRSIDAADVYFQLSRHESWSLEDGIVKGGSFGIEQGVGVRAMAGEKSGFAYADEIHWPALEQASKNAGAIAANGGNEKSRVLVPTVRAPLYPDADPAASLTSEQKIALLERVDKAARDADSRVQQVMVSLACTHDQVLVAAADGTLAADVRPLVRLNVQVIVEQDGRRESASAGGGARDDFSMFAASELPGEYAREAVRQATVNLDAVAAPAGEMTVVLGPGWPGVLLHEAIGHGLEGDFNRKGTSAFSGRMGEQVASELVTVVDDGSLHGRRGSLTIDDEGVAAQCTTLIENGVLTGYMQDKMNARLTGGQSTGNGRRESYAHMPMPRMTNTFMRAGDSDPGEIISSVKNGLYAVNFGGGQVDITSGKFVFSASEAYRIENGKVTVPVKGATLIGDGPSVLTRVSMVGNDLQLDTGVGVCGKEGQSVPVGVGQPTLRIDGLTVGGTAT